MLQELIDLGLHDTKVKSLSFDFENKHITMVLDVIYKEIEDDKGSYRYRKGALHFFNVQTFKLDDDYDFINSWQLVILEGEITKTHCNLFMSSNQRLIVSCDSIEFDWIIKQIGKNQ
jgi:hypothetical protein